MTRSTDETELAGLRAEVAKLRALSQRWGAVVSAPDFETAVMNEATAYHDDACMYQRERDKSRAIIGRLRTEIESGQRDADLGNWADYLLTILDAS